MALELVWNDCDGCPGTDLRLRSLAQRQINDFSAKEGSISTPHHILAPLRLLPEKIDSHQKRVQLRCTSCSNKASYYCESCYASANKIIALCGPLTQNGTDCLRKHAKNATL